MLHCYATIDCNTGSADDNLAYVRVSTAEQASDDRTSLASQQRAAEAIATLRGESIAMTVADAGTSGSVPRTDRLSGASLLARLSPGDVIIAAKFDRLFRSARDALEMVDRRKERGVSVVLADMGAEPVTENGVSKLFFSILARSPSSSDGASPSGCRRGGSASARVAGT